MERSTSISELTPPDTVLTVVRHIAKRFIDDKARDVSITIGLNVIREICHRLAMQREHQQRRTPPHAIPVC